MNKLLNIFVSGILLICPTIHYANVIHVPGDSVTIQAGINGAENGDTVLVAPGTYTGEGNRDIDFMGKNIVVRSENGPAVTIIDCEGSGNEYHKAFYIQDDVDTTTVLEGFMITGAYAPTPDFYSFEIQEAAIHCSGSPVIKNNIITNNYCAGIRCGPGNPQIINNTIADNKNVEGIGIAGCGVYPDQPCQPEIRNCIIRNFGMLSSPGNSLETVSDCGGGLFYLPMVPTIVYCNVEGGCEGEGNIDVNPLFIAPADGNYNYYIQSACLNAGDPAIIDPDESRSDIGVYFSTHPECLIGERSCLYVSNQGDDTNGDGSPEYPLRTIQHALDFAGNGDSVIVNNGLYKENINLRGNDVVLASMYLLTENYPDIENTVIDGYQPITFTWDWGGADWDYGLDLSGSAIACESGEGINAKIIGFTIIGGAPGIRVAGANPEISNNIISYNHVGVLCSNTDAEFNNNVVINNHATCNPGAGFLCLDSANIVVKNATICANRIYWGLSPYNCWGSGTAVFSRQSTPLFQNSIIAYNYYTGVAANALYGSMTIECCDIFGNMGEGGIGDLSDKIAISANFSLDPLFCDTASGDFHIQNNSPCAPSNNECGVLIGALDIGCTATDLESESNRTVLAKNLVLSQNYPNPFNPITELKFSLPKSSHVKLKIFNILGQEVATIADRHFEAGTHTTIWDASNCGSGIYLYQLEAGEFTQSKKMILLK